MIVNIVINSDRTNKFTRTHTRYLSNIFARYSDTREFFKFRVNILEYSSKFSGKFLVKRLSNNNTIVTEKTTFVKFEQLGLQ